LSVIISKRFVSVDQKFDKDILVTI